MVTLELRGTLAQRTLFHSSVEQESFPESLATVVNRSIILLSDIAESHKYGFSHGFVDRNNELEPLGFPKIPWVRYDYAEGIKYKEKDGDVKDGREYRAKIDLAFTPEIVEQIKRECLLPNAAHIGVFALQLYELVWFKEHKQGKRFCILDGTQAYPYTLNTH